ncbi:rho GTPase-activating protein 1 isoform X2 [Malania oleifera]|uniref:rho GTPase-activating protein 1 isoform X2 n=1 Tax=Malania oleifera TaxID=397392 RepID=UPI0025AE17A4|nr:rho GTPase-activating protein 1 isoform X2 [Malania oleifera]
MTEVLHSPTSSSLSCGPSPKPAPPSGSFFEAQTESSLRIDGSCSSSSSATDDEDLEVKERDKDSDQLSLLALLVTLFRKSLIACKSDRKELCAMEIGWPTNVRHVAHVTFDRFNGFLGLPVEFEPEVPRRAPSASANVFGVSTESMQLSYDPRGNSVPTILLMMQGYLYAQGGLQAEGIFRINAENSQEEYVRDQLNRGIVPEGIDVHCLAGLIKMADPLTALMYAVQVMNFLKTLILKTLQERKDSITEPAPASQLEPSNDNERQSPSQMCLKDAVEKNEGNGEMDKAFIAEEPVLESSPNPNQEDDTVNGESHHFSSSAEGLSPDDGDSYETPIQVDIIIKETNAGIVNGSNAASETNKHKFDQLSDSNLKRDAKKLSGQQLVVGLAGPIEKTIGISNLCRINSVTERIEAWR